MMNTPNKTALLCLAFQHLNEITGRTRLQKILYFANLCAGNTINDYSFYQYGPYSEWVRHELETFVYNDIVKEKDESYSEGHSTYSYKLTENGRSLTNAISKEIADPNLVKQIKTVFDKFIKFNKDQLEIMSSLLFLRRMNRDKNDSELVDLLVQYKPKFSKDVISKNLKVFNLLEEMNIEV